MFYRGGFKPPVLENIEYGDGKQHNLQAIYYDRIKKLLWVRFSSSEQLYVYAGVEQDTVNEMLGSDSAGSYVARNVKAKYPCYKLRYLVFEDIRTLQGIVETPEEALQRVSSIPKHKGRGKGPFVEECLSRVVPLEELEAAAIPDEDFETSEEEDDDFDEDFDDDEEDSGLEGAPA